MFDIKREYMHVFVLLSELKRDGEGDTPLAQIYQTVLDVISNDPRFRAQEFIELSQPKESE